MTRRCELTGKGPLAGNNRSHAENKTKRVFRPNLVNVTLLSDVLDRRVRLRVSTNGLKSVEHNGGLDTYLLKTSNDDLSEKLQALKREIKKVQLEKAAGAAA
jgi:large subunit ribosomal protein L28